MMIKSIAAQQCLLVDGQRAVTCELFRIKKQAEKHDLSGNGSAHYGFVSDQPVGTLKQEDTRVVSLYPSPITATA